MVSSKKCQVRIRAALRKLFLDELHVNTRWGEKLRTRKVKQICLGKFGSTVQDLFRIEAVVVVMVVVVVVVVVADVDVVGGGVGVGIVVVGVGVVVDVVVILFVVAAVVVVVAVDIGRHVRAPSKIMS